MTSHPTDKNRQDYLVSTAKAIAQCTGAGAIINEAYDLLIPQQRADRVAAFVKELDARLQSAEVTIDILRQRSQRSIDLLEDGTIVASRSHSSERIRHAATLVSKGMTDADADFDRLATMLHLISQLSDTQIILLLANHEEKSRDDSWWDANEAVIYGPSAHSQSSESDFEKAALHRAARNELFTIGLLRRKIKDPKRIEDLEFDLDTGSLKATGEEITYLGRLLLVTLELVDEVS